MKISNSIMALVFLAVGTSVFVSTTLFLANSAERERIVRQSQAEATAQVFASAVAEPMAKADQSEALKVLTALSRMPGIPYAAARLENGQLLAEMGDTILLQSSSKQTFLSRLIAKKIEAVVPVMKSGTRIGTLEVVADTKEMQAAYSTSLTRIAVIALIAALISVLLAMRMQRYITWPILTLTSKIDAIRAANGFLGPMKANKTNEIAKLEQAFTQLMSEIDRRGRSLEAMAFHDPLTSLGNRRSFQKFMDELVAAETPFCLVLIDIDHFKTFNHAYGHSGGDAILVETAARLKSMTEDGAVFRIGGDEFAAVSRKVMRADAILFSGQLSAAFIQPVQIRNAIVEVTTAFGTAHFPEDGTTSELLLRNCGLALKKAKSLSLGRYSAYTDEIGAAEREEEELVADLKLALSREELELHYQPQVDLASGQVIGFEALVRWKHPVRGNISPAKFVPLAERNGLIVQLGNWVLNRACKTLSEWNKAGCSSRQISVNVSIAQLQEARFVAMVKETLLTLHIEAKNLCIEITESLFAGNSMTDCSRILGELRKMGCSIALDDFGTGYSSLSYLHAFPVDKIKIDKSFVTDCDKNAGVRRLLTGTMQLAHTLGFEVVVEGVEQQAELAVVERLGANLVQGYIFAKPMPISDALSFAEGFKFAARQSA